MQRVGETRFKAHKGRKFSMGLNYARFHYLKKWSLESYFSFFDRIFKCTWVCGPSAELHASAHNLFVRVERISALVEGEGSG
jgi:hypothetical protein